MQLIEYTPQIEALLQGVKDTLAAKGQTQVALAKAASISQTHVSRVLNARTDATLSLVNRLILTAEAMADESEQPPNPFIPERR